MSAAQRRQVFRYLLGAVVALAILVPLWTVFVMAVWQPERLIMQEQNMSNRLLWWVAGPVLIVALFTGLHWTTALHKRTGQDQQLQEKARPLARNDHAQREYVLEVIGLGVTLDRHRQGALWDALQAGSAHVTIREQDKEKYPWSGQDKAGISGGRGGDSLENGVQYTPMYYGVPVFNAEPPVLNALADKPNDPLSGLVGGASSSGLAWHLFAVGSRRFAERPDAILEDVFTFFDENPDVPYIVLNSDDGPYSRDLYRDGNTAALFKNGRYIPEMPDASTLFVLARRERVDAVRPFVFDDVSPEASVDDLNRYGVARRLFLEYSKLMSTVPHPEKETDPKAITSRQPLISEWLPVAASFAQRPELRSTSLLDAITPSTHHIPKDWKPTPWFPIPWNKDQMAEFDKLPTLGFIHRPTYIKFTDAQGKPVTRSDERTKLLQSGWQQALLTLPDIERVKAPSLIVASTGGDTKQLVALHRVMKNQAELGGPEIDTGKSSQFIDTDKRLGNTGAATLFMQMAIGVMGSYRTGGISAAVNLRDKDEASIVFISPPSPEKRKSQTHPTGRADVFSHQGTPAVDPANYHAE